MCISAIPPQLFNTMSFLSLKFRMPSAVDAGKMCNVLSEPMSAYDMKHNEWKFFIGNMDGEMCNMRITAYECRSYYLLDCTLSDGDECMFQYMYDKIRAEFDPTHSNFGVTPSE
jgi:hypothetical protein